MKRLITGFITLYQHTLSPDHGWLKGFYPAGCCRYAPTCSEYTKQSVEQHGVIKGLFLGLARISRCHPRAAFGADPVLNSKLN
jgi:uncharacterized protein